MNPGSLAPGSKAYASVGGAGLAGAIVTLTLYFLHKDPPTDVVAALTTVVGAMGAFIGAYLAPHSQDYPIVTTPTEGTKA